MRPLPPYSYVTGKFPHPTRDPAGHSYQKVEPPVAPPSPDQWRACDAYLHGIELFNAGYYWEAHETWEAVWHAAGRRGPTADFCKALIKLAAAGVKAREGRPTGIRRHATRAKQLLESVVAPRYMGLSLAELRAHADHLIANPAAIINTSDSPVVVVMPFTLEAA